MPFTLIRGLLFYEEEEIMVVTVLLSPESSIIREKRLKYL